MNGFESITIASKRAESARLKIEVEKWKAAKSAAVNAKSGGMDRSHKLSSERHPWAPSSERRPPTPPDKVYSKPRGIA